MEYWQLVRKIEAALKPLSHPAEDGKVMVPLNEAIEKSTQTAFKVMKATRKNLLMERTAASLIMSGLIVALVSGALYYLKLPVLTAEVLAWSIVIGLVGAGATGIGLAFSSIWKVDE